MDSMFRYPHSLQFSFDPD